MKKAILNLSFSGLVILALSAMTIAPPTISGKVTPIDAADAVWAIKDTDTVTAKISSEGTFQVEVQPGTWKLVVSAKAPYRNSEIKEVVVTGENNTDVGEIKLEK